MAETKYKIISTTTQRIGKTDWFSIILQKKITL